MIETKEIYQKDYIQDLTAFGWQPTQETSRTSDIITHHYQIMARETSMPHYNEYRRLENDYETAKAKLKVYNSMEFTTVLLLLLIFIIPGVIYIAYKINQKDNIERNNQYCRTQMQKAIASARNIK